MRLHVLQAALIVVLAANLGAQAQGPAAGKLPSPVPYASNEPMAETFSLAKGAKYLDKVAQFWMNDSCGSCHANFTYMMARPVLRELPDSAVDDTRKFLEKRLKISKEYLKNPRAPEFIHFQSETVGIASGLAFLDYQTTGKLLPTTRQALDHMWEMQMKAGRFDGTWRCGCGDFDSAMVELDRYFSATMAALATGIAPEDYAKTPQAKDGLTRLRRFFAANPSPHLYHKGLLLWASMHVDGLMTTAERQEVVKAFLAKQRTDGGWSLAGISGDGNWSASDGFGTGFAVFILRQAGVPADRPQIVQGVRWLQSNQRASGGWFTPSNHVGHRPEGGHGTRELSLLNASTAFAVMALRSCEDAELAPWTRQPIYRPSGLAFRGKMID